MTSDSPSIWVCTACAMHTLTDTHKRERERDLEVSGMALSKGHPFTKSKINLFKDFFCLGLLCLPPLAFMVYRVIFPCLSFLKSKKAHLSWFWSHATLSIRNKYYKLRWQKVIFGTIDKFDFLRRVVFIEIKSTVSTSTYAKSFSST